VTDGAEAAMMGGCDVTERPMGRRSPARLRASGPFPKLPIPLPVPDSLSPRGLATLVRLERRYWYPGAVNWAIREWQRYLRDPNHDRYRPETGCGCEGCCWHDPVQWRDVLERLAQALPAADARRFRRRYRLDGGR
jgi:hypothetical protein